MLADQNAARADEERALTAHGGGGSNQRQDQQYRFNTVPPDGPLSLVRAWPALDVPETRTVIDATGVRDAVSRVVDPCHRGLT